MFRYGISTHKLSDAALPWEAMFVVESVIFFLTARKSQNFGRELRPISGRMSLTAVMLRDGVYPWHFRSELSNLFCCTRFRVLRVSCVLSMSNIWMRFSISISSNLQSDGLRDSCANPHSLRMSHLPMHQEICSCTDSLHPYALCFPMYALAYRLYAMPQRVL